ncbi:hypothetical protein QQS45_08530 [Alteriqipengyuania flavescens]|uniref:hypothetical protein n=1 Tax=Alteriqipengyuania flavescens TaxID=3053610 RepID=UPI0025B53066|nr:hypothetical protein [Alteriqipengyuania flavescens]WJY17692.1 hypothetical protein QQW98_08525 [Alteriqipengyuania flavescens]WJY23635.1 hypothetical protein QQS45_08530 [Alteriqipengyuania flavescens]
MTRAALSIAAGLAAWHLVHPLSQAGHAHAAGLAFVGAAVAILGGLMLAVSTVEGRLEEADVINK